MSTSSTIGESETCNDERKDNKINEINKIVIDEPGSDVFERENDIKKEGWLILQDYWKKWQSRYVRIEGSFLCCYKNILCTKLQIKIDLKRAQLLLDNDNPKRFIMENQVTQKKIVFGCSDQEEALEWIDCIEGIHIDNNEDEIEQMNKEFDEIKERITTKVNINEKLIAANGKEYESN